VAALDDRPEEQTVPLGPGDVDLLRSAPANVSVVSTPLTARRFGRYELLGRMAQGGMADIYLAQQVAEAEIRRHVVIKCIRPCVSAHEHFLRMFLREARVALHLKHPHICHVYDFGRVGEHFFLAMEWVEGASLLELLRRAFEDGPCLPVPVVLRVVADVAEALDYVHRLRDGQGQRLGVVHRDVSPQNVVIGWDGAVKLLDFGVARVQAEASHTLAGTVAGKFGYMAPEQCREERLDGRCDVFALGIVLFEALVGRRLYQRKNDYETMKAILEEPPPSLRECRPSLPEELGHILQRTLAKAPDERYSTAGELALALHQHMARQGALAPPTRVADVMHAYFGEEIRRGMPALETDTDLLRALPQADLPAESPWCHGPIIASVLHAPRVLLPGSSPRTRVVRYRPMRHRSRSRRMTRFVLRRPLVGWGLVGLLGLLLSGVAYYGGMAAAHRSSSDHVAPAAVYGGRSD
jgi:eukaryotic-like serine/threonine-protein kinase